MEMAVCNYCYCTPNINYIKTIIPSATYYYNYSYKRCSSSSFSSNTSLLLLHKKLKQPLTTCSIRARAAATPTPVSPPQDVEKEKQNLLRAIQDTQRGLVTTPLQRSAILEALVSIEKYDAGMPMELAKLDGTWRLQYTSASDVLILLQSSSSFPFFQVGPIYQKFECSNQSNGGIVRNVVRWSIPNLLEEQEGATLLVTAMFSMVSTRNIYLQFDEISIQNISISEQLQAVIAPALLPRSFLSLQILQFIQSFRAQIPVRNSGRRSVGGLYYLSYLDQDMLLGRADSGGVFIFTKSQPLS